MVLELQAVEIAKGPMAKVHSLRSSSGKSLLAAEADQTSVSTDRFNCTLLEQVSSILIQAK